MPSPEELRDEGRRMFAAWQARQEPGLLDAAITNFQEAVANPGGLHGDQLQIIGDLLKALAMRFQLRSDNSDLDGLISLLGLLLRIEEDRTILHRRGRYLMTRYFRKGSTADLNSAVLDFKKALAAAGKAGDATVYEYALDMAWACETRFDLLRGRTGESENVWDGSGVERWRGPRDLVAPIHALDSLLPADGHPPVPSMGPPPPELVPRMKADLASLLSKYAVNVTNRPPSDRAQDWARAVDLLKEALDEAPAGSEAYVLVINNLLGVLEMGQDPEAIPGVRDFDPALWDRLSAALEEPPAPDVAPVMVAVSKLNLARLLTDQGRIGEAVKLYRELSSGPSLAPSAATSPESVRPGLRAAPVNLQAADAWSATALKRGAWHEVVEARGYAAALTASLQASQQDWSARYIWSETSGRVATRAAFALAKLDRPSEAADVLSEGRTIMLAGRLSSDPRRLLGFNPGAGLGRNPVGTMFYLVWTAVGSMALRCQDGGEWSTVWLPGLSVELGTERFLRYAEALVAFQRNSRLGADAWMAELDRTLGFLRDALDPLVQGLPSGDITIVPVGILTLLPVGAALLDDPPSRGVSVLPGLGLRPAAASVVADRALVVADPALRWADWEHAAVSAFFPHSAATPSDASPQAILAALPPNGVVHFACHGIADAGSPLESQLQLPGGGKLTVRDILQGQLPPLNMVVLSACDTGMPDPYSLDEGIAFPAAFLAATGANVISTLWKVADLGTALLILRFYWEWRHEKAPGALALARAQGWQRSTVAEEKCAFIGQEAVAAGVLTASAAEAMTAEIRRRSPSGKTNPFGHPYFWAAFTFAGRALVNAEAEPTGPSGTQEASALYRSEEAVAIFDQVVARFGEAAEPELRQQVATAL